MRKIIVIMSFICIFTFLISCENEYIAKDTLFFENTKWGMTKAEVCKAMKIAESDLESVQEGAPNNAVVTTDGFLLKNYRYAGVPCDMILFFQMKMMFGLEREN